MVTIAEKMRVLWYILIGCVEKHPPCSFHTVLQAAAYRVKYPNMRTVHKTSNKSKTMPFCLFTPVTKEIPRTKLGQACNVAMEVWSAILVILTKKIVRNQKLV